MRRRGVDHPRACRVQVAVPVSVQRTRGVVCVAESIWVLLLVLVVVLLVVLLVLVHVWSEQMRRWVLLRERAGRARLLLC